MSTPDFTPFPKLARLNRDIVVTEKLDGTNAAVVIVPFMRDREMFFVDANRLAIIGERDSTLEYHVYAQSRNRFITPGKSTDNAGFAGWVAANAEALVNILGAGTHFGEWWGSGIQRGYGLTSGKKRFSLFNTARWDDTQFALPGLGVVPILYEGPFSTELVNNLLQLELRIHGSAAAPGFMNPEGIVIWHEAARQGFKVMLEGDAAPKQGPRNAHDLLPTPEAVAA